VSTGSVKDIGVGEQAPDVDCPELVLTIKLRVRTSSRASALHMIDEMLEER